MDMRPPLAVTLLVLVYILGVSCAEYLVMRSRGKNYPWNEVFASFGVSVGRRVVFALGGGAVAECLFVWGQQYRIFDLTIDKWSVRSVVLTVVLFLLIDFLYYWHHRMMHQIRLFWADHAVHHSSQKMVMPVAERIGWFGALTGGVMIYLPAVLLGFSPKAVFIAIALNLLYQYWVHTEQVGSLGWLEYILNTPSHHRVHHASNPKYLDSNYGGVLIVFDKIFGTFTTYDPDEKITYGLMAPLNTNNPFRIATHEWVPMLNDVVRHRTSPKNAISYLLGRPGWSHDGSRQTSLQLKTQRCASPGRPDKG